MCMFLFEPCNDEQQDNHRHGTCNSYRGRIPSIPFPLRTAVFSIGCDVHQSADDVHQRNDNSGEKKASYY